MNRFKLILVVFALIMLICVWGNPYVNVFLIGFAICFAVVSASYIFDKKGMNKKELNFFNKIQTLFDE